MLSGSILLAVSRGRFPWLQSQLTDRRTIAPDTKKGSPIGNEDIAPLRAQAVLPKSELARFRETEKRDPQHHAVANERRNRRADNPPTRQQKDQGDAGNDGRRKLCHGADPGMAETAQTAD